MSNRIDQYRATYQEMPDAALLELAGELDQLTDDARTALSEELERRGIAEEAPPAQDQETIQSNDVEASRRGPSPTPDLPEWGLFGAKTPALPSNEFVAVFSAGSESEAEQVQQSLRAARIESQVEFVVLVPQAESEKALEVLADRLDSDLEEDEETEEEQDGERA